jgi:hypothetical protein
LLSGLPITSRPASKVVLSIAVIANRRSGAILPKLNVAQCRGGLLVYLQTWYPFAHRGAVPWTQSHSATRSKPHAGNEWTLLVPATKRSSLFVDRW